MKNEVKEKFPLMEIVARVDDAMKSRGWNKAKLTKESGASSAAVTRFFQDGKISSENTLKILTTVGLLVNSNPHDCPIKCDENMKNLCRRVKKVMSAKDGFSRALESNIFAFEESIDLKREVQNLKEVISPGRSGGTPKVPARRTA